MHDLTHLPTERARTQLAKAAQALNTNIATGHVAREVRESFTRPGLCCGLADRASSKIEQRAGHTRKANPLPLRKTLAPALHPAALLLRWPYPSITATPSAGSGNTKPARPQSSIVPVLPPERA